MALSSSTRDTLTSLATPPSRLGKAKQHWQRTNNKARPLAQLISPSPVEAALNSTIITKKLEQFMMGYPEIHFRDYRPFIRFPIIIIAGTGGTYFVCGRRHNAKKYKAFLHGLRAFAFLSIVVEKLYNETQTPDEKGEIHLDDKVFFTTIFLSGLLAGGVRAYRFTVANKDSLKAICQLSCKRASLLCLDIFTRSLVHGTTLITASNFISDLFSLSWDADRQYQITFAMAVAGSLFQSLILDPSGEDSPILELSTITILLLEIFRELIFPDDLVQSIVETIIWGAFSILSIYFIDTQLFNRAQSNVRELDNESKTLSTLSIEMNPTSSTGQKREGKSSDENHSFFAKPTALPPDLAAPLLLQP